MTDPQHEETFADTERKLRETITTLRAQLAEARAVNEEMQAAVAIAEDYMHRAEQRVATLEAAIKIKGGNEHAPTQDAYDAACRSINEQRARADRAEAALAAQIEADAEIAEDLNDYIWDYSTGNRGRIGSDPAADAIRNQPHDRTALDRYREKVLREAAEILDDEGWLGMSMHRILALIEKPE